MTNTNNTQEVKTNVKIREIDGIKVSHKILKVGIGTEQVVSTNSNGVPIITTTKRNPDFRFKDLNTDKIIQLGFQVYIKFQNKEV